MTPMRRPADPPDASVRPHGRLRRIVEAPSVNVALFAFLLNYPWEFLQAPLFRGMAAAPHWDAVKLCTAATLGDAAIETAAFWAVAAVAGPSWVLRPGAGQITGFVAIGLAITVLAEWLATRQFRWWEYADAMPIVPLLGVGLSPLLQWILLPPLLAWFVRRQLT